MELAGNALTSPGTKPQIAELDCGLNLAGVTTKRPRQPLSRWRGFPMLLQDVFRDGRFHLKFFFFFYKKKKKKKKKKKIFFFFMREPSRG